MTQTVSEAQDNSLLTALASRANSRMSTLMSTYMLGRALIAIGQRWFSHARTEMTYSVAVTGDDDLYVDLHAWLIAQLPSRRRRSLVVRSKRSSPQEIGEPNAARDASLTIYSDDQRSHTVEMGAHRVQVNVERPELSRFKLGDEADLPRWVAESIRMVFTTKGEEARDAVVDFLADMATAKAKRPARMYIADRWGSWNRRADAPVRSLETVVLRSGQKEDLTADLGSFLVQEELYSSIGMPYHRGYLFHGPPGTGKTSIAKALATHFHMDVYYVPLPVVADDSRLINLMSGIEGRSMLLLEDIDVVHASHVRNDSEPGVTLSGLLNCLDGVVTPHGLITVLTTNVLEGLDPALTRPGRIDRLVHLPLLDDDQFARLTDTFLGQPVDIGPICAPISPAQVIEIIKRHLDHPDEAAVELKALVG